MRVVVVIGMFFLVGCSGLGLNKRMTVVPDELAISQETTPDKTDTWKPSKIILNVRWKIEKPKDK